LAVSREIRRERSFHGDLEAIPCLIGDSPERRAVVHNASSVVMVQRLASSARTRNKPDCL
jgi:hypothetical protein